MIGRFSAARHLTCSNPPDPRGRLPAARHLTWNRNYNIKPREISGAQDRLNTSLSRLFERDPRLRPVVLPAMAAAGRGGSSDVGQRIRDEILAVQSKNNCKVGGGLTTKGCTEGGDEQCGGKLAYHFTHSYDAGRYDGGVASEAP